MDEQGLLFVGRNDISQGGENRCVDGHGGYGLRFDQVTPTRKTTSSSLLQGVFFSLKVLAQTKTKATSVLQVRSSYVPEWVLKVLAQTKTNALGRCQTISDAA